MLSDSKASIRQNDFTSFSSLDIKNAGPAACVKLYENGIVYPRDIVSHTGTYLFVVPKQPMYHRISVRPSTRLPRGSYCPLPVLSGRNRERILHAVHDSYPGRPMESLDVNELQSVEGRKVEGQQIK
jgi:hypothetical protein